jgi:hypothetical protein
MIDEALRMIQTLMNAIQGEFDHTETAYEYIIQKGDGEDIIFYLKQAQEYQVHKYEIEIGKYNPKPD